jgi:hypothetical protein
MNKMHRSQGVSIAWRRRGVSCLLEAHARLEEEDDTDRRKASELASVVALRSSRGGTVRDGDFGSRRVAATVITCLGVGPGLLDLVDLRKAKNDAEPQTSVPSTNHG